MVKKALTVALISTLGLAVGCSSIATNEAGEEVVIGLTYVPNIQFAPYYVAYDAGYFEEAGVSVQLRHHAQDEDLFGAIEQGKEHVIVAGGAEMVQAQEQGIDVLTFQTLYTTYPVSVIVPEDSDIATLEDLEGQTLGVPGRFGETWFGTLAFLKQAGLTEEDVNIKEIGFTQQAALSAGHVDAVVGFFNNDVPQLKATGLDVRAIDVDPVPIVGVGNGTTSAMIEDDPAAIEAIAQATRKGVEDIMADPARAVEAAENHIPGTITDDQRHVMMDVVEATNNLYGELDSDWGIPDMELWQQMNDFMVEVELIDQAVDLDRVVTDRFIGSE